MLQLAFELTGPVISVAVFDQDRLMSLVKSQGRLQHAETLFPLIEFSLAQAGITKNDLDLISVCNGPGSFTGIRMAVAGAKLMAWALNCKLVAVSSLELLHERMRKLPGSRLALLDARGGRVYASLYRGGELSLGEDKYELAAIVDQVKGLSGPLYLAGSGTEGMLRFCQESLQTEEADWAGPSLCPLETDSTALSAEYLARMAWRMAQAGDLVNPLDLEAHYCSLSQAERLRIEAGGHK